MDKFCFPYNKTRTTKRFCYKKSGIYIIKDIRSNKITYIGMSKSCVYKACYRHFQTWVDNSCRRVVYDRNNYVIRIILVNNIFVDYIERRLIKFFKPEDNYMLYENEQIELTEEDRFWFNNQLCPY